MTGPGSQKPPPGLQGLAAVPMGGGGASIRQRNSTYSLLMPPRGVGFVPGAAWPADARPVRPGCGARGRWRGIHPTTQLHLLSARAPSRRRLCSGRRMACRCAACEAWLRCPWAVAGSRSHNAAPLTLDSWLPRGVGFVPGAAWPARPLAARAASCARRVVSKPGQALQALRRPPQGRHLLSTVLRPSPVCLAQRPYT